MPPPARNDTCTSFCPELRRRTDEMYRRCELMTLTFDLETGMRVASKVGNLPTEFGHARPSDSRIIRYVRDGRTYIDRRTDKSNAYCPFLYERGHNKEQLQARLISFPMHDRAGKWKIPSRQDYHFPYRKKSDFYLTFPDKFAAKKSNKSEP